MVSLLFLLQFPWMTLAVEWTRPCKTDPLLITPVQHLMPVEAGIVIVNLVKHLTLLVPLSRPPALNLPVTAMMLTVLPWPPNRKTVLKTTRRPPWQKLDALRHLKIPIIALGLKKTEFRMDRLVLTSRGGT